MSEVARGQVLALSGGVGGAKLALGLSRVMDPAGLTVVANTGDDFVHLGLPVSPDIDTLVYTLSGLVNTELGWGRAGETWTFMAALEALGGETWFQLGDGDLAMHVERGRRLAAGEGLGAITADISARLGIGAAILPMSDDLVRTIVETPDGPLDFQHYFVRERCAPTVTGFRFDGVEAARPQPLFLAALEDPDLAAVIICPSNPFISIDPILALPGVRAAMASCPSPVIAVSPIVGGRAIKGPTAKMMGELGMPAMAAAVAAHYGDVIDGFVIDQADATIADQLHATGLRVHITSTVMKNLADREALAREVLGLAAKIGDGGG
ncbi:MAG: 2-phospho-L-lactate transferase [Alphaproteobacteria bacterium]